MPNLQRTIQLILISLTLGALVTGCDEGGVKGAKGYTPAKYVVCSLDESNCFVHARFRDLSSCQSFKERDEMFCDSRSTPGVITCRKEGGPVVAAAYCTF